MERVFCRRVHKVSLYGFLVICVSLLISCSNDQYFISCPKDPESNSQSAPQQSSRDTKNQSASPERAVVEETTATPVKTAIQEGADPTEQVSESFTASEGVALPPENVNNPQQTASSHKGVNNPQQAATPQRDANTNTLSATMYPDKETDEPPVEPYQNIEDMEGMDTQTDAHHLPSSQGLEGGLTGEGLTSILKEIESEPSTGVAPQHSSAMVIIQRLSDDDQIDFLACPLIQEGHEDILIESLCFYPFGEGVSFPIEYFTFHERGPFFRKVGAVAIGAVGAGITIFLVVKAGGIILVGGSLKLIPQTIKAAISRSPEVQSALKAASRWGLGGWKLLGKGASYVAIVSLISTKLSLIKQINPIYMWSKAQTMELIHAENFDYIQTNYNSFIHDTKGGKKFLERTADLINQDLAPDFYVKWNTAEARARGAYNRNVLTLDTDIHAP